MATVLTLARSFGSNLARIDGVAITTSTVFRIFNQPSVMLRSDVSATVGVVEGLVRASDEGGLGVVGVGEESRRTSVPPFARHPRTSHTHISNAMLSSPETRVPG